MLPAPPPPPLPDSSNPVRVLTIVVQQRVEFGGAITSWHTESQGNGIYFQVRTQKWRIGEYKNHTYNKTAFTSSLPLATNYISREKGSRARHDKLPAALK
eukprot:TRINITY_DN23320_c0_g1_i1.p1 TRINITY_DN23320_c0_g1~~TRINITY_DN23320_c0_g1_i1.p1  ORF type:complete len:100 (-),score=4.08 TRINITY_DN23320_c0_g1_i1:47-346(-)